MTFTTSLRLCYSVVALASQLSAVCSGFVASRGMVLRQGSFISATRRDAMGFPRTNKRHRGREDSSRRTLNAYSLKQEQSVIALPLPHTLEEEQEAAVLQDYHHGQQTLLPLLQLALAGAVTTLVGDMAVHPIDCIKTLQQSETGWQLGLADSLPRAAAYLWETSGVEGFYRGFMTYAVTDALGGACKFATWEVWKRRVVTTSDGMPSASNLLLLLLGAGLAFMASSVCLVPGELIKQHLQMGHYEGVEEAASSIWSSSGIRGFFVGYDGVCYRDVPYTMMELGLYEVFKAKTAANSDDESSQATVAWQELAAASAVGTVAAFFTTPLDVIKTKLMIDADYADASFFECLTNTLDLHGWSALFCGVEARVAWIVPFLCIYLPLYDALKRLFWKRHVEHLGIKE
jgi:solute carrier family 25 S-adenosylmethionine transporter 26